MRVQRQITVVATALGCIALSACVSDEYDGGRSMQNVADKALYEDNLTPDSRLGETWKVEEKVDTPLSGRERIQGLPEPREDDDGA